MKAVYYIYVQLYGSNDVQVARLSVLKNTNMVDYAQEVFKSLNPTEDVPAGDF